MSDLKKIYAARGPGDAHVLHGLLQAAGIASLIRGDDFVPFQDDGLFHMETRPTIWVLDDEPYADALELAAEYTAGAGEPIGSAADMWRCRSCGEAVEAQFTECWSCGESRS